MRLKKNIRLGKINFFNTFVFLIIIFFCSILNADNNSLLKNNEKFVLINILDKVSSKNYELEIEISKETKFKNLLIKIQKCKNSEFDDNPETTAYIQVIDISTTNNDEVFVFNDWAFSSSPALRPFDHPVYDIWLIKCY